MPHNDIRTRDTVQPTNLAPVLDNTKPLAGLDTNRIFDSAIGAVTTQQRRDDKASKAKAKADREANDLFFNQQENEFSELELKTTAEFSVIKGINALKKQPEFLKRLKDDISDRLSKTNSELKPEMEVRLDKVLRRFLRSSSQHQFKETHEEKAKTMKAKAIGDTRQAIRASSGSFDSYIDAIIDLDKTNREFGNFQGFNKTRMEEFQRDSRSAAHLQAIEALSTSLGSVKTQAFFDKVSAGMNPDDLEDAKKLLKQSEDIDIDIKAQDLAAEALGKSRVDSGITFIRQNSEGKTRKAAMLAFSQGVTLRDKGRKQDAMASLKSKKQQLVENEGVITPNIRRGVPPEKIEELEDFARFASTGKFTQTKNQKLQGDAEFSRLSAMSDSDDPRFLTQDIDEFQGLIHPDRIRSLKKEQEKALNRKRSGVSSVQNMSSSSVAVEARNILSGRNIFDEQFNSFMEISPIILQNILEENPKETDKNKIKHEWRKRFELAIVRIPKEFEPDAGFKGSLTSNPFFTFGRFNVFRGDLTQVTRPEAIERFRKKEQIVDLQDLDPDFLTDIQDKYKKKTGNKLSETDLQRWVNNIVLTQFRIIPDPKRQRKLKKLERLRKKREREERERINNITQERGTF